MKNKQTLKKLVLSAAAVAVMSSLSAAPALAKDNGQQNVNQSNVTVNQVAEADGDDGLGNANVAQNQAQVNNNPAQVAGGGGIAVSGDGGSNEAEQVAAPILIQDFF